MTIKSPYLLFLGDAKDQLAVKVAQGIAHWRPEKCIGQLRLHDCQADCNVPDMTLEEAKAAGVKTLILGVANRGGIIAPNWIEVLKAALEIGFDIASGLHAKLTDIPVLSMTAKIHARQLFDVRHPTETFSVGTGIKRSGKRILPVGTDCSCGKMYTALALEKELLEVGEKATFRATGQTGILICGSGVSVDAVVSDFISGAVEALAPENDNDHWDIIEGQGSLFHPSYAGVTLGLIHGAQPDALVLCHEPTRSHMRGLPHQPIPDLQDCINANLAAAKLTNPNARFIGISVNTANYEEKDARQYLAELEKKFKLPATDPFRFGVQNIIGQII